MTKRGRGVSTRLKAISMTFRDGLITAEDKNRLKDLLLLGDSSLEDALDGVLSGDKTKILGYLLHEEPDQRLRAESAKVSATRMRLDSNGGVVHFENTMERLSKELESTSFRASERKGSDAAIYPARSSGSSLFLDDLNLDELLQGFDLEQEAIGSFDLQRSSLEAIRDALDMYDQQFFADKENDAGGVSNSPGGLAGTVETDSDEAILSQVPFGLFSPEAVPAAPVGDLPESKLEPSADLRPEYSPVSEPTMAFSMQLPAEQPMLYGRSRSCDSEQRKPPLLQQPLPRLLNRHRRAMTPTAPQMQASMQSSMQSLTQPQPQQFQQPQALGQEQPPAFHPAFPPTSQTLGQTSTPPPAAFTPQQFQFHAGSTPSPPPRQQQQQHAQQQQQQQQQQQRHLPAVPQRPMSMPLSMSQSSFAAQFGVPHQQQLQPVPLAQAHPHTVPQAPPIPRTPPPTLQAAAPRPTPFLQQFAAPMPGFSPPQQTQPQVVLPPPVPHYQQLAMHFCAGSEPVASTIGSDRRRSYRNLAPAPPSGLAGYMGNKLPFAGGAVRPAFSPAGGNMAWLTNKLNQDIIQLVARGNINEQDRKALIRLGMTGDGYLRSKIGEAVREALQADTAKLTALLCIGQSMFQYRHPVMQHAQSVYSPKSEPDSSDASSVSSVTAESVEIAKQTARLSQEIASIEQQIATKKEEVIRYRDMSDMDTAVQKMRELKYLETCANNLRRQMGILRP